MFANEVDPRDHPPGDLHAAVEQVEEPIVFRLHGELTKKVVEDSAAESEMFSMRSMAGELRWIRSKD